jgi:hypothetical protein
VEYLLSILEEKNYAMASRNAGVLAKQQLSDGSAVL